jgi:hypothetical protein
MTIGIPRKGKETIPEILVIVGQKKDILGSGGVEI